MSRPVRRRRSYPLPTRLDLRYLVVAHLDTRGRCRLAFETRREASKERLGRVWRLERALEAGAYELSLRLKACRYLKRCHSMACPECERLSRRYYAAQRLHTLEKLKAADPDFVTTINPSDSLQFVDLGLLNPRTLLDRFRRQLDRIGLNKMPCLMMGRLDLEYDEGWELIQPHFHLITVGLGQKHLTALTEKWKKDFARVRVRKRISQIDRDLPRVVAYLHKTYLYSVARKGNPKKIYPHHRRRLRKSMECTYLVWIDKYREKDLTLNYGLKNTNLFCS